MKTIDEQFENEQDYSQNDLSATELTAGDNDDSLIDDESDTDYEDDTDTGLKDDELIFNDDDNEEYADGRSNGAGSGNGDNMDDDPDF
jgi:hypothetical protein